MSLDHAGANGHSDSYCTSPYLTVFRGVIVSVRAMAMAPSGLLCSETRKQQLTKLKNLHLSP